MMSPAPSAEIRSSPDGVPAALGGRPIFTARLRLTEPTLPPLADLAGDLAGIWDRRQLANDGPLVQAFARQISTRIHQAAVVPTASGTAGLMTIIRALGITGEVIVPAFTFSATALAVVWAGARPVFADVDPERWDLSAATAAPLIGPRTEAILAVHLFGQPSDQAALSALARRHGLALLFDAAHAFGSRYDCGDRCDCGDRHDCNGRPETTLPVGLGGDAEVFSFHATKLLAVGEGGAIVTRDEALGRRCADLVRFGDRGDGQARQMGLNGKMQEWNALLGLRGLDCVDAWIARRAELVERYRRRLRGVPGLQPQDGRRSGRDNHQYYALRLGSSFELSADHLVEILRADGIEARRYFAPALHRHAAFAGEVGASRASLPVAERLAEKVVCLPLFSHMGDAAVDGVCLAMERAYDWRRELAGLADS